MSFGASSDYFGLGDANWEMQENSKTPEASSAQAQDEFGDVACEVEFEETESVEVTYKVKSNGTSNEVDLPANFVAGHVATFGGKDYVITGGTLSCTNGDRPVLTVSGEELHGPDDGLRLYDFATNVGSIKARKVATAIGFTLGADTLLNGTSVAFSTTVNRVLDKDGAIAVMDLSEGRIESTPDLISCSATPTAIVAAGWTRQTPTSNSQSNTSHQTGGALFYRNIEGEEQIAGTP